jgi:hypothetical protein
VQSTLTHINADEDRTERPVNLNKTVSKKNLSQPVSMSEAGEKHGEAANLSPDEPLGVQNSAHQPPVSGSQVRTSVTGHSSFSMLILIHLKAGSLRFLETCTSTKASHTQKDGKL